MKNVMEFMRWAASHASPARIPSGSTLCVPLSEVGIDGIWEYLYGTTGAKCTQSLLEKKYTQYYKGWGWSKSEYAAATAGWVSRGVTVCDCQGLEDYFAGRDTNAKGNYANLCESKGRIKDISRAYVIGEAVFCGSRPSSINHVGWVAGFAPDGEALVLHERGLSHGCVIERISQSGKSWTYRGLMTKRYIYGEGGSEETPEIEPEQGEQVKLSITTPYMRGDGIKLLQQALNALGYDAGKEDGICGSNTMAAIEDFCNVQGDGQQDIDVPVTPREIEVNISVGGKKYIGKIPESVV